MVHIHVNLPHADYQILPNRDWPLSGGRVPRVLESQPSKKSDLVLRLVEELDIVPQQYLKKLVGSESIWEIRSQIGGNSYRLLGFFDGSTLLVLTSGFSKKQQNAPTQEIELAERRRREYISRRKP
ncbi:MAG: type II toxin-antitoxin system RelE/ParE family toxin [Acidobacteriota bacterium]